MPWKVKETLLQWWEFIKSPDFTNPAIAIATVVIAIATWLTYREVHNGSTQTDRIIEADERIAKAMEGGLTQAQIAFTAANKQAILTQRAWLKVDVVLWPQKIDVLKIGNPVDVEIMIKNTGRTPALNVKDVVMRGRGKLVGGTFEPPDFFIPPAGYTSAGNLTPDDSVKSDIVTGPLDAIQFSQIVNGELRVYSRGRVEYDDVFGAHHWLTFCQFLLPTGAFSICPAPYNDMDRN